MAGINVHDYISEIRAQNSSAVVNSDGCGFIVSVISREWAGMPNSYFFGVGKLNIFLGQGPSCAFWSEGAFKEILNFLLAEIDTYSIDEELNKKALYPVLKKIIDRHEEEGSRAYIAHIDSLKDIMSEFKPRISSGYRCLKSWDA